MRAGLLGHSPCAPAAAACSAPRLGRLCREWAAGVSVGWPRAGPVAVVRALGRLPLTARWAAGHAPAWAGLVPLAPRPLAHALGRV